MVPENALTYEDAFDTPEEMEAVVSTLHSYGRSSGGVNAPLEGDQGYCTMEPIRKNLLMALKCSKALINHDWLPEMGMNIHHWGTAMMIRQLSLRVII